MQEKRIHQIFVASVLFKGVHALIEIVGGVALYLISTDWIVDTINRFSCDQLIEDPDDWIATHLLEFARTFSVEAHNFYAFYLLSHGIVKDDPGRSACCARNCGPIRRASPCSARSSPTSSTATASPTISR